MTRIEVPGILLLYHRHLLPTASTIMEHVDAFQQHSQYKVWSVNTELGFPVGLEGCQFQTVVVHYSLFSPVRYHLDEGFRAFLGRCEASYKIAFFQDEYHYCQQRFDFLNRYAFDCVYTLVEPDYAPDVYFKHSKVKTLVYTIPGYVPDDLVGLAKRYSRPERERQIDVGYRGRTLPPYMGRGASEKAEIGIEFQRRTAEAGLKLDIEVDERGRLYGERWHQFLGNCRAVLGVEAGVSIFDIDDRVRMEYERLTAAFPNGNDEGRIARLLAAHEGNIPYRTSSPRHFEAASLGACQILFEGEYSGTMEPMRHYIPLKKDFSNLDEVLTMFRDVALRREIAEHAYRDLIASDRYSYRSFIEGFDHLLLDAGLTPMISSQTVSDVDRLLRQDRLRRELRGRVLATRYRQFPGRSLLRDAARRSIAAFGQLRAHHGPRGGGNSYG